MKEYTEGELKALENKSLEMAKYFVNFCKGNSNRFMNSI